MAVLLWSRGLQLYPHFFGFASHAVSLRMMMQQKLSPWIILLCRVDQNACFTVGYLTVTVLDINDKFDDFTHIVINCGTELTHANVQLMPMSRGFFHFGWASCTKPLKEKLSVFICRRIRFAVRQKEAKSFAKPSAWLGVGICSALSDKKWRKKAKCCDYY